MALSFPVIKVTLCLVPVLHKTAISREHVRLSMHGFYINVIFGSLSIRPSVEDKLNCLLFIDIHVHILVLKASVSLGNSIIN